MQFGWTCLVLSAGFLVTTAAGIAPAADSTPPAAPPPEFAKVVPGTEREVTVVSVTRIVNYGAAPIQSVEIRMRAPVELAQQTVTAFEAEGAPIRAKDRWGATVLRYTRAKVLPGQCMTGRWTATATLRQYAYDFKQSNDLAGSGGPTLSPQDEKLYLRDADRFALSNPVLQEAAREAVRGRDDRVAKLEGIFDLVMKRLQYMGDSRWKPAPEVLAAGGGSCSEYTFCFVALCRANGIPARYVAGFTSPGPEVPFRMNTTNRNIGYHRYSQAFLPGMGWVDFDPTATDGRRNPRRYFGRAPQMLLICMGDGGDGSLTDWEYRGSSHWKGKKSGVLRHRVGWWFSTPPPPDVKEKVIAFRQRMKRTSRRQDRQELVDAALAIGHPFVLPWLDDLLYEPGIRVDAAKACLKIGGDAAVEALINSLGSPHDIDGDRQIGEILCAFAGQQVECDRESWLTWLNTPKKKPDTEKPGDTPVDQ